MADRGLIDELIAGGVFDRASAEEMANRVLGAIAARVRSGRTVQIDGIGRLGSRAARKDCYLEGPAKVVVKVACVKQPVELSRGEPRRVVSA